MEHKESGEGLPILREGRRTEVSKGTERPEERKEQQLRRGTEKGKRRDARGSPRTGSQLTPHGANNTQHQNAEGEYGGGGERRSGGLKKVWSHPDDRDHHVTQGGRIRIDLKSFQLNGVQCPGSTEVYYPCGAQAFVSFNRPAIFKRQSTVRGRTKWEEASVTSSVRPSRGPRRKSWLGVRRRKRIKIMKAPGAKRRQKKKSSQDVSFGSEGWIPSTKAAAIKNSVGRSKNIEKDKRRRGITGQKNERKES